MVTEVSLSRYFHFMETARLEPVDRLSEAELTLLLDAQPHASWAGCRGLDPAQIAFDY